MPRHFQVQLFSSPVAWKSSDPPPNFCLVNLFPSMVACKSMCFQVQLFSCPVADETSHSPILHLPNTVVSNASCFWVQLFSSSVVFKPSCWQNWLTATQFLHAHIVSMCSWFLVCHSHVKLLNGPVVSVSSCFQNKLFPSAIDLQVKWLSNPFSSVSSSFQWQWFLSQVDLMSICGEVQELLHWLSCLFMFSSQVFWAHLFSCPVTHKSWFFPNWFLTGCPAKSLPSAVVPDEQIKNSNISHGIQFAHLTSCPQVKLFPHQALWSSFFKSSCWEDQFLSSLVTSECSHQSCILPQVHTHTTLKGKSRNRWPFQCVQLSQSTVDSNCSHFLIFFTQSRSVCPLPVFPRPVDDKSSCFSTQSLTSPVAFETRLSLVQLFWSPVAHKFNGHQTKFLPGPAANESSCSKPNFCQTQLFQRPVVFKLSWFLVQFVHVQFLTSLQNQIFAKSNCFQNQMFSSQVVLTSRFSWAQVLTSPVAFPTKFLPIPDVSESSVFQILLIWSPVTDRSHWSPMQFPSSAVDFESRCFQVQLLTSPIDSYPFFHGPLVSKSR